MSLLSVRTTSYSRTSQVSLLSVMSSPRSGSNHGSQPQSLSSSAFASSSAFHRYLIQPLSPKGWTSSSAGASERASQRLRRMGAPPGATPDKLQVTTDKTLCDTGAPVPVNAIDDYCPIDDDDDDGGSRKKENKRDAKAATDALSEAYARGRWLLGLLVLQSTSSVVLDKYQELLKDHIVVTLFLTMLVGAGGNCGNQSAIQVIRGLATGSLNTTWPCFLRTFRQQIAVGSLLGVALGVGGYARVSLSGGSTTDAAAISAALAVIVVSSAAAGTVLPFAFARAGVDPANSGTSIQVLMDVAGVTITCGICRAVFAYVAQTHHLAESITSAATAMGAGA